MNSNALILRLAESTDARAIATMSRDYIESGLGWKYDSARIERAIQASDVVVLVACDQSEMVGLGILVFGETRAHLVLLALRPRPRPQGTGRRMMQWLLESAQTAGIETIHLELRAGNEAARAFYRVLGFAPTIRVPGYYGGREAALRMIRVLRHEGPLPFQWQPPMTNK
jgi:ribosomal-protein-alanine N-acetyltransferase